MTIGRHRVLWFDAGGIEEGAERVGTHGFASDFDGRSEGNALRALKVTGARQATGRLARVQPCVARIENLHASLDDVAAHPRRINHQLRVRMRSEVARLY